MPRKSDYHSEYKKEYHHGKTEKTASRGDKQYYIWKVMKRTGFSRNDIAEVVNCLLEIIEEEIDYQQAHPEEPSMKFGPFIVSCKYYTPRELYNPQTRQMYHFPGGWRPRASLREYIAEKYKFRRLQYIKEQENGQR